MPEYRFNWRDPNTGKVESSELFANTPDEIQIIFPGATEIEIIGETPPQDAPVQPVPQAPRAPVNIPTGFESGFTQSNVLLTEPAPAPKPKIKEWVQNGIKMRIINGDEVQQQTWVDMPNARIIARAEDGSETVKKFKGKSQVVAQMQQWVTIDTTVVDPQ